ncbi:tRNA (adenosine(37)-N6)-threonylcarbamoyltransferase complex ATPase subunit type 1 TsaE [Pseudostreptobacillus hongkongensis]|uniref:tRNA (adenosine(37)-N6)-threonylcarbamoyltransferase complex ATPase subunit type 1 TsaE n=1 Tax=Pseudostreptobacillus hongkongensis TaxID=1162717 RepID=UPI00082AE6B2|nr:tRNA (adenosine(37)-N6)-threonylcarbamoyltransferase complex ATPase subunit type 1 TsaE [Pseudostreptobacillus hongkongensis]
MENKILNFEEINNLIDKISEKIKKREIRYIALIGDLGTGKTHISKRICRNLGVLDNVKSPTFTYVLEYNLDEINILHFDLYRLSNIDELYEIGYDDYLDSDNNIFLVEWANNVVEAIPDDAIYIELTYNDIDKRFVSVYIKVNGEKKYLEIAH